MSKTNVKGTPESASATLEKLSKLRTMQATPIANTPFCRKEKVCTRTRAIHAGAPRNACCMHSTSADRARRSRSRRPLCCTRRIERSERAAVFACSRQRRILFSIDRHSKFTQPGTHKRLITSRGKPPERGFKFTKCTDEIARAARGE